MKLSSNYGIWTRLLTAFGIAAAFTIITALTALLVFERSGTILTTITEKHLPEVVQVSRFENISGRIIAVAPSLASASDEPARRGIQKDLDLLLAQMKQETSLLKSTAPETGQEVDTATENLEINLMALQRSVSARLQQEAHLSRLLDRLRWLYADLLDEIEPLNQDLSYNLDAEIERMIGASLEGTREFSAIRLKSGRKAKEAMEHIGSSGALLVSLMQQVSTANGEDQVDNIKALSGDAVSFLRHNLGLLTDEASSLTLRQLFQEIFTLAEGERSVFSIKGKILARDSRIQEILSENRILVGGLRKLMDRISSQTRKDSVTAAKEAKTTLLHARMILAVMVILSILTSSCVLLFYVRGSIVARLDTLGQSMNAIAGGDLDHPVPESGSDEIGEMAKSLRIFRDTAIKVEEANAQAIIDNAAAGLVIAEADGKIRFFNPMAATLFSSGHDILLKRSLASLVTESGRANLRQGISMVLGGESQITQTLEGIREDGSIFPMDVSIRPVTQRNIRRLMVTLHDVTERENNKKLLELRVQEKTEHLILTNTRLREEIKERRKAQNELVQAGKLAALGQLTAGIAHELNQPLSAMGYYLHNADLLIERGRVDTHRENLSRMKDLTTRMGKMINHLKNFARWPENTLKPVSVPHVIEQALSMFSSRIKRLSVMVEIKSVPEEIYVSAGIIRLEQVLINVIGNSLDALEETMEQERALIINTCAAGDTVTISVKDTGPGISHESRARIFDPFFTTKEVGKGLGLGLSISYNIMKDFGGSIHVSDKNDIGTEFVLSLNKAKGSEL